MTDDLDARTKQLAKELLEALDREDDPDRSGGIAWADGYPTGAHNAKS